MPSFLSDSAKYIFEKHAIDNIRNAIVVLPSRRAVFFFKKELAACSDIPFLSPLVFSIDDFVLKFSGLKTLDSVSLLFELFEIFKEIDPDVSFDKFIGWAQTLLKDFDSIDQAMVEDPHMLFNYMSEAEAIKRWDLEENSEMSTISQLYFGFFEKLSMAYSKLYQRLLTQGLAYRGMSYRIMANEVEKLISENANISRFYFVGLNALSRAEERIIESLVKAGKAECLWDTDEYYMKTGNKAGKVLREYKNSGKYGEWNWINSYLINNKKEIRIFGLSNNVFQAKLATKLIERQNEGNAVIVVLDEGLIQPLLLSIPDGIKDYNITMGLPLGNSLIASFIDILFEIQQNKIKDLRNNGQFKYNHRAIFKLINHPIIRILKNEHIDGGKKLDDNAEAVKKLILSKNMVYISVADLLRNKIESPLFELALTDWEEDPVKCLEAIQSMAELLRDFLRVSGNPMESEFFFVLTKILNRLDTILKEREILSIKSLKILLKELFKQERVPFSGEPVAELQIMSMLETRCLDFDNVYILSLNEGILPSSNKNNSLIPYDAAKYFGLPLYADQDSVMAYHFFRLMQRAQNVNLIYLLPDKEGVGGGKDKSRFIYQVEEELSKANPNIRIEYPQIEFEGIEIVAESEIEIEKSSEVLVKTKNFLRNKGFYPSSVNQYVNCTLQFYWSHIDKISEPEEVDDTLGPDIFGNILHKTLELIDQAYMESGAEINELAIEIIKSSLSDKIDSVIEEHYGGYETKTGLNSIFRQIAGKLLVDFFDQRLKDGSYPFYVLATEEKIRTVFPYDHLGESVTVQISGFVDKIEWDGAALKIIDYKTGKVESRDLKPGSKQTQEEALMDPGKGKLRQLYIYRYILMRNILDNGSLTLNKKPFKSHNLIPQIYSFRNLGENLELEVSDDPEKFISETSDFLSGIISEILNESVPFKQTEDTDICKYCDFINICRR
ncbi:hypothetical protein GVN16_17845 [Emticicia sp. CRIBPO]|uniref:PD-(D/E)XK nuclease family protein n=1 Tax=Emticicia sp. CRIBPO TaxID=2683258 RepID=UPI001411E677|nr:PD-(D/E)XK nuclease family protein [Emticicia sp. CRIBPO]NBA87640.1 hypothetical protein [Emticicia sp. CRIBPO]